MNDGFDGRGETANGLDDSATQSTPHAGEPPDLASDASYSSGQDGGPDTDPDMGDGGIVPFLAPPASTAPTYRRSLFRR